MEWQYWESIEPFPENRVELYLAQHNAMYCEANSGEKQNIKDHLLFEPKEEPKKQTEEDHIAIGKGLIASIGKKG